MLRTVLGFVVCSAIGVWLPGCGRHVGAGDASAAHSHQDGHSHGSATGDEVELSAEARKNLKLVVAPVQLSNHWRTILVPGEVADVPGRSDRRVAATMSGVITRVHVSPGQSLKPGDPLVDIQLTSEPLASAQTNLLRILQDIELNEAELLRLTAIAESGALAQKTLLEKKYERKRLESAEQFQVQELLTRGMTAKQVDSIRETKNFLREYTVVVPTGMPSIPSTGQETGATENNALPYEATYLLERLPVFPGLSVTQGQELCTLADHQHLQLRGESFESESERIHQCLSGQWPISAVFEFGEERIVERSELKMLYASSVVDEATHTICFFVPIENEVIRDTPGPGGIVFRSWRFKPGQKVRLQVPIEQLTDRIVLPAEAVVTQGSNAFVYRSIGTIFKRKAVTIDFRDERTVVLAKDGGLRAGAEIAMNGAYQIELAIQQAAGGGHAGHSHDH